MSQKSWWSCSQTAAKGAFVEILAFGRPSQDFQKNITSRSSQWPFNFLVPLPQSQGQHNTTSTDLGDRRSTQSRRFLYSLSSSFPGITETFQLRFPELFPARFLSESNEVRATCTISWEVMMVTSIWPIAFFILKKNLVPHMMLSQSHVLFISFLRNNMRHYELCLEAALLFGNTAHFAFSRLSDSLCFVIALEPAVALLSHKKRQLLNSVSVQCLAFPKWCANPSCAGEAHSRSWERRRI